MEPLKANFERDGFAVLSPIVEGEILVSLRAETDRLLQASVERGGARNALRKSAVLREWGQSESILSMVSALLGPAARLTKLTLFDKSPGANWKVPWHQDLTISVAERREADGFGPWSVKDGVPHVQPPAAALQRTLALRVHLDATPEENGALRVVVGSHTLGKLTAEQMSELRERQPQATCPVAEGGAMLMSPLLVHASSPSASPSRRRVLHYEFSSYELPGGLEWA